MAAKLVIKHPNNAITSEMSQSLFLAMFTSDNIITVLNNNMLSFIIIPEECGENASLKT